ncbi:hypothetical protein B0H15DRAFT_807103 [Mycena belliarum]|uniref:Uncharacterized protein n=1 Tax=Mycena belliarum TaxID=1033014 RepID=A0AAD6TS57_9AGAR|nr:hypothetical protein B0H15DRAFT_807103 [Mycena belliae]
MSSILVPNSSQNIRVPIRTECASLGLTLGHLDGILLNGIAVKMYNYAANLQPAFEASRVRHLDAAWMSVHLSSDGLPARHDFSVPIDLSLKGRYYDPTPHEFSASPVSKTMPVHAEPRNTQNLAVGRESCSGIESPMLQGLTTIIRRTRIQGRIPPYIIKIHTELLSLSFVIPAFLYGFDPNSVDFVVRSQAWLSAHCFGEERRLDLAVESVQAQLDLEREDLYNGKFTRHICTDRRANNTYPEDLHGHAFIQNHIELRLGDACFICLPILLSGATRASFNSWSVAPNRRDTAFDAGPGAVRPLRVWHLDYRQRGLFWAAQRGALGMSVAGRASGNVSRRAVHGISGDLGKEAGIHITGSLPLNSLLTFSNTLTTPSSHLIKEATDLFWGLLSKSHLHWSDGVVGLSHLLHIIGDACNAGGPRMVLLHMGSQVLHEAIEHQEEAGNSMGQETLKFGGGKEKEAYALLLNL